MTDLRSTRVASEVTVTADPSAATTRAAMEVALLPATPSLANTRTAMEVAATTAGVNLALRATRIALEIVARTEVTAVPTGNGAALLIGL